MTNFLGNLIFNMCVRGVQEQESTLVGVSVFLMEPEQDHQEWILLIGPGARAGVTFNI